MKCSAITKGGSRCNRPALTAKRHCLMHDPESADLRREAGRKGGRNRSAKARAAAHIPDAMTADALAGWLSQLFKSTMIGRTEPKIATACAAIARTLLETQAAAAQPNVDDLVEQVAVLRAMVDANVRGQVA